MGKTRRRPTRKELDDSARATASFLRQLEQKHRQRLEGAIRSLEVRIARQLAALETTRRGTLRAPKANLKIAQKQHAQLARHFQATFGQAARSAVDDFDTIAARVRDSFAEVSGAVRFSEVDRAAIALLKKQSYGEYLRFGTYARERIAGAMYQHIAAQAPFENLQNAVKGVLTGHRDVRGRSMLTYATQFAVDTNMHFHNSVTIAKAASIGLDHFRFTGSIIRDSRQFCIDHRNKVYSKAEIESWRPTWAGAAGPALQYRGGYQCRHNWQPVDAAWFASRKGKKAS